MIYTLTPNPAIDMNVNADEVVTTHVNRTRDAVYTPNGKGLNVSFTLGHFSHTSPILGFFGGFSGNYIVEGAQKIQPTDPVWIDGITRVNIFVTTPQGEYKFPNAGAPVDRAHQLEMLEKIRNAQDLDCLVVSGSLPPEISPDFYRELQEICANRGADIVLDMSHPSLKEHLSRKPLLIKPNDEELADIFGLSCETEADIVASLEAVHAYGAQNILLTLGERGAYFSNGEHIWQANPITVKLLSSACAGDATLAAFLSIWYEQRDKVEDALKRAMATGANVAESAGLGDFAHVESYAKQVEVRLVK